MKKGFKTQQRFEQVLLDKGKEILANIGPNEKLFVLVSQAIQRLRRRRELAIARKIRRRRRGNDADGNNKVKEARLSDEKLHSEIYWSYGQKILRAAEIIKRDNRLFAVWLPISVADLIRF